MDREEGWAHIGRQRAAVADELATLGPEEWRAASLCRGWTVRDVGAHLSIAPTITMGETMAAVVRARGSFDRMIHDTAVERAGTRSDEQIVQDLRAVATSRRLAPTTMWRDPLLDIVVHAQDLLRPLGRSVDTPVEASREAADWAWRRGFPFLPAQRLRGVRLVASDTEWSRGDGEQVCGPVAALALLSTGRRVGSEELSGPGVSVLEERGLLQRAP